MIHHEKYFSEIRMWIPRLKIRLKTKKVKQSNELLINCLYRRYFNTWITSVAEDQFEILNQAQHSQAKAKQTNKG